MKRNLASRAALIGLLVAASGCTSSAKRTALPEGTRFTAATDASSSARRSALSRRCRISTAPLAPMTAISALGQARYRSLPT